MSIKNEYKITKSNFLNEMRYTSMNLQEIRFLNIYLAKINPQKPETRKVIFSLDDFRKVMNLGRLNIDNLKLNTKKLLQNVVTLSLPHGGYSQFQLFKECELTQDESGNWCVAIDAHDKALPYFFELKRNFFSYELWNMLRLNSPNQQRMYEILKQHQKQGEWTYSYKELRELLFISSDEYLLFNNFKERVLNACQKALKEITDICYEYELIKKGRNIEKIKFIIHQNKDYYGQITFDEFIESQSVPEVDGELYEINFENEKLEFLADACNNEFSESEMQLLYDLILQIISFGDNADIERYHYLQRKYNELVYRAEKTKINSRFGYLKSIIQADIGGDK
jgi:hypothetical protein